MKNLQDINDEHGNFCISLIQLSEVVNLLKSVMSWENLHEFIMGLISNKSITIVEISKLKYITAVDKMIKYNMDANDLSAYLLMKEKGIKEIYTFDRHFENLPEIVCLPEIPKEF
ncbi:MAG: PIN domain-containing protein [Candidatus Lokiarchaeota archaeon]|nr:PIN domain-containing protein [Candidatus Lokiarchaeota archaeon]MBD3199914.1 PIN domain-containing protein [Candidatus Lokiarchaeota archaeon]